MKMNDDEIGEKRRGNRQNGEIKRMMMKQIRTKRKAKETIKKKNDDQLGEN